MEMMLQEKKSEFEKIRDEVMLEQEADLLIIHKFIDLLDRVEREHVYSFTVQQRLEQEERDILHDIEAGYVTDKNGKPHLERLQEIRQERRVVKNKRKFYYDLKEFSKKYGNYKYDLYMASSNMKKELDAQNKAEYMARINDNIRINGKHY